MLIKEKNDSKFEKEIREFYHEASQHGSILIPMVYDFIYKLVPIFGKSNVRYYYKDIRFPDGKFLTVPWTKMRSNIEELNKNYSDWSQKKNKIYWVGRVTGGRVQAGLFHQLHRWRWVYEANKEGTTLSNKTVAAFSAYICDS